jgi:predicted RNA-binding protein associated with RNAse of E/G family
MDCVGDRRPDDFAAKCGEEVVLLRTQLNEDLIRTEDASRGVAEAERVLAAAEKREASTRKKLRMWEGFERAARE